MKEFYNICIWTDLWQVAGIENVLINILSVLDRKYKVTLIIVDKRTNEYDEILEKLDVNVVVLTESITCNPLIRWVKGLTKFSMFLKDNHEYDIAFFEVSHSIDFLYLAVAKKRGLHSRIANCQNGEVNSKIKRIAHRMLKPYVQKLPTRRLAVSSAAADWVYANKYRNKCKIIYNSIFLENFMFDKNIRGNVRNELGLNNKKVFIHVGRFNEQKNHVRLISIFKAIVDQEPNAILLLLGSGQLKDKIIDLVNRQNLTDNVLFLGERKNVSHFYFAADGMIFPSLYEGMSMVLIEAQAASLPCVVSDTCDGETKYLPCLEFVSLDKSDLEWADVCLESINNRNIYTYEKIGNDLHDTRNATRELENIFREELNYRT